jgi:1-acyl-sn-glycerol-3-phosphate acyltransferase
LPIGGTADYQSALRVKTLLSRRNAERLPESGPVLYLGLHRNGSVDGFVYNHVLGNPVFMISTQLRKNWFARLFFDGIAVTRRKDEGEPAQNDAALRQCLEVLRARGALFVFPEGTSALGPRHLPFKSGAIWLLLDYLETSGAEPLRVVPVGIHYERPEVFRAKVEVVIGEGISTELPTDASRIERLKIMKRRVQAALEEVGINVPSEEYQERIERLAYAGTLGTKRSYFSTLKMLEKTIPQEIAKAWEELELQLRGAKIWYHQNVPLFPIGPVSVYVGILVLLAPFVIGAILFNLPAFLAGRYAGRKFPDGRNVISLWKILVGVPVFALWSAAIAITLLALGKFILLVGYAVVTVIGLKFYYRFKKVAVAVHNLLRQPRLRKGVLAFHQTLLKSLPDERA